MILLLNSEYHRFIFVQRRLITTENYINHLVLFEIILKTFNIITRLFT